ncbi:MAG: DUF1993 family protein [Proteobacteria bacterium]|nr:DUF1993 family protein [Pseudomonadota bacterium]
MTLSMYQASVPMFLRQLASLSEVLKKGESHAQTKGFDPLNLTSARLAPDMFPLTRQVQIATDSIKGCAARLAGVDVPSFPDTETTFPELQERIAKTVAFLNSVQESKLEGSESRTINLKLGPTVELTFTGRDYLFNFAIPNAFFHITTAYDILRHNGVEIGKRDFLGNF